MTHLFALARGLRRTGVALVVLAATVAVETLHATPILSVGSKEVIYSASQRKNLGLNFWPDGNMGVVAGANGQIEFYAANSTSSVRTKGTLTSPGNSKQGVTIYGAGGYNYLAGGPIFQDPTTGTRLMVYHAEVHGSSAQDYYTTLGLAVAIDGTGLYFDDLGTIIRANIPSPLYHSIDIGGGSINLVNGDLYIHYRDYMADGSSAELAVAKAPLATVLGNAWNRQTPQFTKYYNGSYSQPGIGGLASALETGNPWNAWSSVSYSDYLNQFVMASAQPTSSDGGNLYLSTSSDGVTWGPRQAIAVDGGEQFYPSLIGTGANPQRLGQSFYVYYTDSATGAWNRWNDAQLVRRQVTFDPAAPVTPPPQPTVSEWTTISGYKTDFQTGTPAQGWKYQWAAAGKSGNSASYGTLKWSNVAGAYNTTGAATQVWSGGKGHPDDYLSLASWGGHPGQPNYNVIASYTIQADDGAGLYRIANSSIAKGDAITSSGEDGLALSVYVNNTLIGKSLTVPTSGATVNFDRDLGQLNIGDSLYVIVGAGANQNYDLFHLFDFTLQRYVTASTPAPPVIPPPIVPPVVPPVIPPVVPDPPAPQQFVWTAISGYKADFRPYTPTPGWKYQWTAAGKSGNSATYGTLWWSDIAGAYNTTGAATPVWTSGKGHPDDYLSLAAWGGHPGQPNYNVIASYTIQADDGAGQFRIINSSIMKGDAITSKGEDGLTLAVYVNNTLIGKSQTVPTSGAALNFDRDLGTLNIGDTVYVIIGAGANQNYDLFHMFDFTIQKLMPVATMLASVSSVPEPTGALQLGLAMAFGALGRRRRRGPQPWPLARG